MTEEKSKKIKSYEELYELSNHGYVKSLKTGNKTKQLMKNMTAYVRLYKDGKSIERNINELVLEHFHVNYTDQEIKHKDNDFHNCHIDNLNFSGRYVKSKKTNEYDYIIYYELAEGGYRIWESSNEKISTVARVDSDTYPKRFYVFDS